MAVQMCAQVDWVSSGGPVSRAFVMRSSRVQALDPASAPTNLAVNVSRLNGLPGGGIVAQHCRCRGPNLAPKLLPASASRAHFGATRA